MKSQKKDRDGERKEIKFCDGRSMRFSENLKGVNKEGWQRWICSRRPIDSETGAYCSGCAWLPPNASQLKPRIPHSDWCKVVEDDEEVGCRNCVKSASKQLADGRAFHFQMRRFNDSIHSIATRDDTLPAVDVVSQAKHGRSQEFNDRLARIAKDESLARRANRRRNDGSLKTLNYVPLAEATLPPHFRLTRGRLPYLAYDSKETQPGWLRTSNGPFDIRCSGVVPFRSSRKDASLRVRGSSSDR
jgi:hypothetical protein